jgi:ribosome maturation factor RimP
LFLRAVFTPRAEQLAGVRAAAERVARGHGLEIFDVQLRRESIGIVLRVIIDRPDRGVPETPEEAVGIEECQRVSQDLSALLDVEDDQLDDAGALSKNYTLEVSSPGLDRPLRHEADYRRFTGRLAKLVTTAPLEGQSAFSGRIAGVDDGAVILEEGRKRHRVPLARIKRGHLAVEF